jgi:hypothetical protein
MGMEWYRWDTAEACLSTEQALREWVEATSDPDTALAMGAGMVDDPGMEPPER